MLGTHAEEVLNPVFQDIVVQLCKSLVWLVPLVKTVVVLTCLDEFLSGFPQGGPIPIRIPAQSADPNAPPLPASPLATDARLEAPRSSRTMRDCKLDEVKVLRTNQQAETPRSKEAQQRTYEPPSNLKCPKAATQTGICFS